MSLCRRRLEVRGHRLRKPPLRAFKRLLYDVGKTRSHCVSFGLIVGIYR